MYIYIYTFITNTCIYIYINIYRHNISIYIYMSVTCLYMFKWNISFQLKNIFSPEAAWPFQEVELRAPAGPSLSCFKKKRRDHSLLRNKVFNCQKQTYHVHKFLSIKYYINILYTSKLWHQTLVTSKKSHGMGLQMGSNFKMSGLSSTTSSNKPPWSLRHGVSLALRVSWERLQVGFLITLVVVKLLQILQRPLIS